MNRRKFFKVMGMLATIPFLNKLLGIQGKFLPTPIMDLECIDKNPTIRSYSGGLQIGAYDPLTIFIQDGTGAGQTRGIYEHDGPSRTTTVDRDWSEPLTLGRKMNL